MLALILTKSNAIRNLKIGKDCDLLIINNHYEFKKRFKKIMN